MNKTEWITAVAETAEISKKEAERTLNTALSVLTKALVAGDRVQLSGFGIFEVKERKARTGRNPRTRKPVEIAASQVATFKPSKTLKDTLNK